MDEAAGMRERRVALAAATAALTGIGSVLWQEPGPELGAVLHEIDDLIRFGEAARVAVVAEAMGRGEMQSYTGPRPEEGEASDEGSDVVSAGLAGVGWVREWAPSLKAGGAVGLVRLTERLRDTSHALLRDAVLSGRVGVGNAQVCAQEMDRLSPRLRPEAVPTVWQAYLDLAEKFGPREIRALRPRLLAQFGANGELQGEQDTAARRTALSPPSDTGDGTFTYRMCLDAEGKAVLEAALGPLAAPRPVDGIRDLRGSDRRRADALVQIIRRAVASPDGIPTATKAQLFLTVTLDDLMDRTGAATTVGSADAGTVLAPDTVRRIACDASLIPTVMGGPGQVLDLGHTTRWFTPTQAKALWLRDGGCTIPGCGMPAPWADAHHIRHWADGGPSDLANAALLCGYHHTWVHHHRLTASLTDAGRVVWDLTPGSYDHTLPDRH